jgi:DNA-binding NarL/FixJ family response regulator
MARLTGEEAVPQAPPPGGWRVAVVEDHALVRDGLVTAVAALDEVSVVYAGPGLAGVLDLDPPPQLLLLDLELDGHPVPLDDVATLQDRGVRVLVVSALGLPDTVRDAVRLGVAGVVSKREDVETMLAAVREVLAGGSWMSRELAVALAGDRSPGRPDLSPQERRVLVLYASGLTLDSVARRLGIRPGTAREYLDRVRGKYEAVGRPARSKVDLTREAIRDGFVDP